ncbi:hypothetical protein JAAARDRAFT_40464 [Jaapia argillacea MUCL 33604]|uniref:Uncharacterized protein n=1 Tax=Jaapia argillacea MUCL 33604 TaxID=933084 RepID=A0A067PP18_9AGAM|nr:hypothetical protein JAAARDRAFT_40464 [Jaapia argillacea MUCL 33604]
MAIEKNTRRTLCLAFIIVTIFIQSVYYAVELTNGQTGHAISTQVYFNMGMITLPLFSPSFLHPDIFALNRRAQARCFQLKGPTKSQSQEFVESEDLNTQQRLESRQNLIDGLGPGSMGRRDALGRV